MQHPDQERIHIDPDPQTAGRDPIQATPGAMEDVEDASALANRTEPQRSLRPSSPADAAERGDGDATRGAEDASPPEHTGGGPDWGTAADPMR